MDEPTLEKLFTITADTKLAGIITNNLTHQPQLSKNETRLPGAIVYL